MARFRPERYVTPASITEAVSIIARDPDAARPLAGGTTLYELGKKGMIPKVKTLIDLRALKLDYIEKEVEYFRIGAMTTLTSLQLSGICDELGLGALRDVLTKFTPIQIKNLATLGGEVCAAVPFLDLPPVLISLDATLKIQGPKGDRMVPVEGFSLDFFLPDLSLGDILLEVRIPRFKGRVGSAFVNLKRNAVDLALLNASVKLELDKSKTCVSSRVGIGGISRAVFRATKVEERLNGKKIEADTAMKAASSLSDLKPIGSIHASSDYKRSVLPPLLRDCILTASKRAEDIG